MIRVIPTVVAVVVLSLVGTQTAAAFTCPSTTLEARIAEADTAFVGRSTGSRLVAGGGIPQRIYTFEIDQAVKGDLGATAEVRIPIKASNGGQAVPLDVAAGILASPVDGLLFTTRCGITDPGALLASVDKPQGNAIKLGVGAIILLLVLGYSLVRLKRRGVPTTLPR